MGLVVTMWKKAMENGGISFSQCLRESAETEMMKLMFDQLHPHSAMPFCCHSPS